MPDVLALLRRLRPLGVPGRARRAPVPSDPRAALEAEVAPLFSALEPVARRAERELAGAARDADAARRRARDEAAAILSAAEVTAAAVQRDAAAQRLAELADEAERLVAAARHRAGVIERAAAERSPALADQLAHQVVAAWSPPGTSEPGSRP